LGVAAECPDSPSSRWLSRRSGIARTFASGAGPAGPVDWASMLRLSGATGQLCRATSVSAPKVRVRRTPDAEMGLRRPSRAQSRPNATVSAAIPTRRGLERAHVVNLVRYSRTSAGSGRRRPAPPPGDSPPTRKRGERRPFRPGSGVSPDRSRLRRRRQREAVRTRPFPADTPTRRAIRNRASVSPSSAGDRSQSTLRTGQKRAYWQAERGHLSGGPRPARLPGVSHGNRRDSSPATRLMRGLTETGAPEWRARNLTAGPAVRSCQQRHLSPCTRSQVDPAV
jgi:hypothetical protein